MSPGLAFFFSVGSATAGKAGSTVLCGRTGTSALAGCLISAGPLESPSQGPISDSSPFDGRFYARFRQPSPRHLESPELQANQILKRFFMSIKPLHDRVVVKRIEAEDKSAGGIIIPDNR